MQAALAEARLAAAAGEVPVGAVLVVSGKIVARAHNTPIALHDPTAHAEINLLRAAALSTQNYRLENATLYSTLEPCVMCAGALVHARVGTVVFGAAEPKSGALVSTVRAAELPGLNHRMEAVGGVLEQDCGDLMRRFFRERRV